MIKTIKNNVWLIVTIVFEIFFAVILEMSKNILIAHNWTDVAISVFGIYATIIFCGITPFELEDYDENIRLFILKVLIGILAWCIFAVVLIDFANVLDYSRVDWAHVYLENYMPLP